MLLKGSSSASLALATELTYSEVSSPLSSGSLFLGDLDLTPTTTHRGRAGGGSKQSLAPPFASYLTMTKMTEILFRPGLLIHKLGIKITPISAAFGEKEIR